MKDKGKVQISDAAVTRQTDAAQLGLEMKILMSSIVDLKRSQHNRPHQFVRQLTKKHEVTVVSIRDRWKQPTLEFENSNPDFDEFLAKASYIYPTGRIANPILQELLSRRLAKRVLLQDSFDVHLNYNTLILGQEFAKTTPTMYDLADDLTAMIGSSPQINQILRPLAVLWGDRMLRRSISISKLVSVTSPVLAEVYNIPRSKVVSIANGVDTDLFRYDQTAKSQLGYNDFIVGYVGVLREWVDFEPLFCALGSLDAGIRIIVVGKEGGIEKHRALAVKHGVSDRVTFVGEVRYGTVPKYISAMDICVIPFAKNRISNGALPLKLFEYMSCERPVVSAELSGVRAAVGNRVLYASCASDYAQNIRMLYEDANLRKSMGSEGRRFVLNDYSWNRITRQMEDALCSIAE